VQTLGVLHLVDVTIIYAQGTLGNMVHAHVAHFESVIDSPRSGSDQNRLIVTLPSRTLFITDSKSRLKAQFSQHEHVARVVTSQVELSEREGGECVYLIRRSNFLPTFHVGLNLTLTPFPTPL
jgi:DNA repair protein RadC